MSLNIFGFSTSANCRPICLEVNPPRGVDARTIFARLDGALAGVDYLNVTDCALARLKMSGIVFGAELKRRYGKEVLVNLSCRDRNSIGLQSELLGAWMLGVRSVVALTGDAVTVGDSPEAKGVFEMNSVGLLNCIAALNGGRDLAGVELRGAPRFVCGVVVNPNVKNPAVELRRLERKKAAGAVYALSQPVFEVNTAVDFLRSAADIGMPILLGLLPFKSAEAALAFTDVPGIRFSDRFVADVSARRGTDLSSFSSDLCLQIAETVRPLVAGYHVISGATPALAIQFAGRLAGALRG